MLEVAMARKEAGRRYPHATTDAREHNHAMCPVVQAWADYASGGAEPWGTLHTMPALADAGDARRAVRAFYAARYCKALGSRYGEPVSIQAGVDDSLPGRYVVWFRVWPRSIARAEIARRAASGEPLAYNVLRKGLP